MAYGLVELKSRSLEGFGGEEGFDGEGLWRKQMAKRHYIRLIGYLDGGVDGGSDGGSEEERNEVTG